jgi:hypothetical protein
MEDPVAVSHPRAAATSKLKESGTVERMESVE